MAEGRPTFGSGKKLFANARPSKLLCIPVYKTEAYSNKDGEQKKLQLRSDPEVLLEPLELSELYVTNQNILHTRTSPKQNLRRVVSARR